MTYAKDTSVPVERSQREIEQLVTSKGAKAFLRATDGQRAIIGFQLGERRIQFMVPLPKLEEVLYAGEGRHKRKRTPAQQEAALEQAERQRWRALALTIKAKLVSVETGVETFEEAFLAQIVVSQGGKAVPFAQLALPAIQRAYDDGDLPPLLPPASGAS